MKRRCSNIVNCQFVYIQTCKQRHCFESFRYILVSEIDSLVPAGLPGSNKSGFREEERERTALASSSTSSAAFRLVVLCGKSFACRLHLFCMRIHILFDQLVRFLKQATNQPIRNHWETSSNHANDWFFLISSFLGQTSSSPLVIHSKMDQQWLANQATVHPVSYPTILEVYAQHRLNQFMKEGVRHLVAVSCHWRKLTWGTFYWWNFFSL